MIRPVEVRSPIADPWESGRPVKLCWRFSQVTREGFAEVPSAKKKKKGSRSLKVGSDRILDTGKGYLLQIRVRPILSFWQGPINT